MRVRIVIDTFKPSEGIGSPFKFEGRRQSTLVWQGEIDILDNTEYITKISLIGEGQPQPLCEVPFALGMGHYQWMPPLLDEEDYSWQDEEEPKRTFLQTLSEMRRKWGRNGKR